MVLSVTPKQNFIFQIWTRVKGGVKVSIVRPWTNPRFLREVSDWSIVIISNLPDSLTGSRGEYFRVVGIHSDG